MKEIQSQPTEPNRTNSVRRRKSSGFTLAELLVSMAVLSILLLMLTSLLDQIQKTWAYSENRISQFREARVAFDILTKNLSQAGMNTYWDYDYNDDNEVEDYKRQSELHFKTLPAAQLGESSVTGHALFFQGPLGFSVDEDYTNLDNLFNARGYFIQFGSDDEFKPRFIKALPRFRYRLMEYRPPAEENLIFVDGDEERIRDQEPEYTKWFRHNVEEFTHPLAENIVMLVVSPRETLEDVGSATATYSDIAPRYEFDSNSQDPGFKDKFGQMVPPLVKITMVAIDETSAVRLEEAHGNSMPQLISTQLFDDTTRYEKDLEEMKASLIDAGVNFKVFSTMVAIRSSKWSTLRPL